MGWKGTHEELEQLLAEAQEDENLSGHLTTSLPL
jgi:hypothetical protein